MAGVGASWDGLLQSPYSCARRCVVCLLILTAVKFTCVRARRCNTVRRPEQGPRVCVCPVQSHRCCDRQCMHASAWNLKRSTLRGPIRATRSAKRWVGLGVHLGSQKVKASTQVLWVCGKVRAIGHYTIPALRIIQVKYGNHAIHQLELAHACHSARVMSRSRK